MNKEQAERKIKALKMMYKEAYLVFTDNFLVLGDSGEWFMVGHKDFKIPEGANWFTTDNYLVVKHGKFLKIIGRSLKNLKNTTMYHDLYGAIDVGENLLIIKSDTTNGRLSIYNPRHGNNLIETGVDENMPKLYTKDHRTYGFNIPQRPDGVYEVAIRLKTHPYMVFQYMNVLPIYERIYTMLLSERDVIEVTRIPIGYEAYAVIRGTRNNSAVFDVEIKGKLYKFGATDIKRDYRIFGGVDGWILGRIDGITSTGFISKDGRVYVPIQNGARRIKELTHNTAIFVKAGYYSVVTIHGKEIVSSDVIRKYYDLIDFVPAEDSRMYRVEISGVKVGYVVDKGLMNGDTIVSKSGVFRVDWDESAGFYMINECPGNLQGKGIDAYLALIRRY